MRRIAGYAHAPGTCSLDGLFLKRTAAHGAVTCKVTQGVVESSFFITRLYLLFLHSRFWSFYIVIPSDEVPRGLKV